MRCKRGTFVLHSQAFVPQINVRITDQQLLWLESEVKPFRNKSAVIRDLIDSKMQGVDGVAKLGPRALYRTAGPPQGNLRPLTGNKPSLKQPEGEPEILQDLQQLPPPQTEAVPPSAQEPDHKKNIYKVVKNEIKAERPVNHALRRPRAPLSSRPSGSGIRAAATVPTVSPNPRPWLLWGQLVPDELQPDDLMRAIDGAIEDIRSRQGVGEFASPLPDCFRWLRDECYAVYLEDNTPASTKSSMFL